MKEIIIAGLGVALLAGIRAAIVSYRAKKSVGNIVVDAIEAAIDEVDHK